MSKCFTKALNETHLERKEIEKRKIIQIITFRIHSCSKQTECTEINNLVYCLPGDQESYFTFQYMKQAIKFMYI